MYVYTDCHGKISGMLRCCRHSQHLQINKLFDVQSSYLQLVYYTQLLYLLENVNSVNR